VSGSRIEWTDGQIQNNDGPDDIRRCKLTITQSYQWTIHVNGAVAWRHSAVDILDVGPLLNGGFTVFFAGRRMECGFLRYSSTFLSSKKRFGDRYIQVSLGHIPDGFGWIPHPVDLLAALLCMTWLGMRNKRDGVGWDRPDRGPWRCKRKRVL